VSAEAYQAALIQLSESNDATVQGLYQRYIAGVLSLDRFLDLVAQVLATGNGRATTLASTALWRQVAVGMGRPMRPIVMRPEADAISTERLRVVVAEVEAHVPDYVAVMENDAEREAARKESVSQRLSRVAVDEPTEASVRATQQGITRYTVEADVPIRGWRRRLDPDPCKLCRNWAGDGKIYKPTTRFWRHNADQCVPEPVFQK
jgi:hypothetical protein